MRLIIVLLLGLMAIAPAWSGRSARTYSSHSSRPRAASAKAPRARKVSRKAAGVRRDAHGSIKRSGSAKRDFQRTHPCPATGKTSGKCPGYLIDHIVPLKRGGADAALNMQWQTKAAAKAKDRIE